MKNTPGPWEVKCSSAMSGVYTVRAHNGVPWGDQDEANARLISAAPELIEALKNLYDAVTDERADAAFLLAAQEAARAAIAKAEA